MSLDTDIAQLTGSANALIETFNAKEEGISQAVIDALKAVPEGYKTFYVDQVAGNDENDGSSVETALKSINEAEARTPVGGVLYVLLCSDYTMDKEVIIYNKIIRIASLNGSSDSKFNFSFGVSESGGDIKTNGFISLYNSGIHFEFIRINLPDITGLTGSLGNSSSCIGPRVSGHSLQFNFKLTYSEIVVPANPAPLLNTASSMIFVVVLAAIYPAEMAGHWVRGIAAGTSIDTVNNIYATGISTL